MKELLIMTPCRERHHRMLESSIGDTYHMNYCEDKNPSDEVLSKVEVIVGEPTMTQILKAEHLKWIQMTWAGADRYTRNTDFPKDILLTNGSGIYGGVISEYVMAGILFLYRKLRGYDKNQQMHLWKDLGSERMIAGKRVLIVGAGDIGTGVAKRMAAFDAVTVGIRRRLEKEKSGYYNEMYTMESLDEQLRLADIVVCALPSTPLTDSLIGKERLMMMKKDALIVNVGRGSVIVTKDLEDVLLSGHLFGAVLDVVAKEPLAEESPLWAMDNVLLTPHISGPTWNHSPETEDQIYTLCIENLKRYASGEELQRVVDFGLGYCR